jgi:threonine/homoserine/homoserine lactone efflux protein
LPIDPLQLPAFLLAVALVELTPGPNMGYLAVLSAGRGRAAGFAAVMGVTAGLAVYMVAAAVGLTEVLLLYPTLLQVLRWAGVAYILYLAWEAWRGAVETSPGHHWRIRDGGYFWRGFLANVLNPKAAVFYVMLLPGFFAEGRGSTLVQSLVLGALHLVIAFLIHGAVVLLGARAGRFLDGPAESARGRRIRRGFALALVGVAVWLAVDTAG